MNDRIIGKNSREECTTRKTTTPVDHGKLGSKDKEDIDKVRPGMDWKELAWIGTFEGKSAERHGVEGRNHEKKKKK